MYMSSNSGDKNKKLPPSSSDASGNTSGAGGAAGSAGQMGMLVATPFLLIFCLVFGSWELSLLIDQVKCHKGIPGCLLPTDAHNFPYQDPALKDKKSGSQILGSGLTILSDMAELKLGKILGITPKKQTGGARRKSQKKYKQRGGAKPLVNNLLTSIDVNGFRPFDMFNGPVQFPYSLAHEQAPWYEPSFLNFGKWFGHMQITAWSTARMVLSGYFAGIGSLMKTKNKQLNEWSRLGIALVMPIIIGIALVIAPFVSVISSIWGMFKGGYNYLFAIIFLFFPVLTILTTVLQHFCLIAYIFIGGLGAVGGSGSEQWAINKSIMGKLLANKWIQFILFILMTVMLVIVLAVKAQQDGLFKKKESFQTQNSSRKAFSSNFSSFST